MTANATKCHIPSNVQYFMKNWDEGYNFGFKDGVHLEQYVTNFTQEKHGFMTGYFIGYIAGYEKKKGYAASLIKQDEIRRKMKSVVFDGKEYLPEIKREYDRSGDDK